MKRFALALLIFSIAFAQQEHHLTDVTPVDANLNMSGYNISVTDVVKVGNSQSSYIHFSEDLSGSGFSIVFDGVGTGDANYIYIKGGAGSMQNYINLLRISRDTGSTTIYGGLSVSGASTLNAVDVGGKNVTGVNSVVGDSTLELEGSGGLGIHITSGGNVGVGAVPGSYKLDVSGAGRLTGDLTVSGGNLYMGNNQINDLSGAFELYSDNSGDKYVELQSNDNTYGVIIREDLGSGGSEWGNLEVRDGKLSLGFNNNAGGLTITDQDCVRIDAGGGTCTGAEGLVVDGSVGIGTTVFGSGLNVSGSVEAGGLLDTDGSNFFDGGCTGNQHITGIDSTGAITCGSDTADIDSVRGGEGISGGGGSGTVTLSLESDITVNNLVVAGSTKFSGSATDTVLYGFGSPASNPRGGGFRIRREDIGNPYFPGYDALVIEKLDPYSTTSQGGIAFTMYDTAGEITAMEIEGDGDVGIRGSLYDMDGNVLSISDGLLVMGSITVGGNDIRGDPAYSDRVYLAGISKVISEWNDIHDEGGIIIETYCTGYNKWRTQRADFVVQHRSNGLWGTCQLWMDYGDDYNCP